MTFRPLTCSANPARVASGERFETVRLQSASRPPPGADRRRRGGEPEVAPVLATESQNKAPLYKRPSADLRPRPRHLRHAYTSITLGLLFAVQLPGSRPRFARWTACTPRPRRADRHRREATPHLPSRQATPSPLPPFPLPFLKRLVVVRCCRGRHHDGRPFVCFQ